MITKETLKKQLDALHEEGSTLLKPDAEAFEGTYQSWYTKALPLIKQLAADRYAEFRAYYEGDPGRGMVLPHNYAVQDYLLEHMPTYDDFDHEYETARCISSQLHFDRNRCSFDASWGLHCAHGA